MTLGSSLLRLIDDVLQPTISEQCFVKKYRDIAYETETSAESS